MFLARECFRGQTMSRHLLNTFRRSLSNGAFQQKVKNNEEILETKQFSEIYRCREILIGSLINRLKKFQLYATCTTVPFSFGLFLTNYCNEYVPFAVTTVGTLSLLGMLTLGQFFTRTIGFIYISEDRQEVKFSYADFWGRRKDVCLPIDEILPVSHSPNYFTNMFYNKVFLTSSVKPLKLMKFGEVTNSECFYKLFDFYSSDSTEEPNN